MAAQRELGCQSDISARTCVVLAEHEPVDLHPAETDGDPIEHLACRDAFRLVIVPE